MDTIKNNTKSQKTQKRRLQFKSTEEMKAQLATDLYRLRRYSAEDLAEAFDVTRQTLRNRTKAANKGGLA